MSAGETIPGHKTEQVRVIGAALRYCLHHCAYRTPESLQLGADIAGVETGIR